MKKMILVLLCTLSVLAIYGCANKSNAELVDIEQFKCQASIETVVNVLGEGELKENRYRYENVNLWGHNGNAVFELRDDKDTIKKFLCYLRLNDKEFDELISIFSDKYGSYRVTSSNVYSWTISEEDGKIGYEEDEIGFDKIYIVNLIDKEYEITFSDEWASSNDEEYFEAVKRGDSDTLALVEADVCGDSLVLFIEKKENEYELYCMGTAEDKMNASVLLGLLYTTCEEIKGEFAGYSLAVTCNGNGVCTILWDGDDYIITSMNADGSYVHDFPDWYLSEVMMSDNEIEEYMEAYHDVWLKFAEEIEKI